MRKLFCIHSLLPLLKNRRFSQYEGKIIAQLIPVHLNDEFNRFLQQLDTKPQDNAVLDNMIQIYQLRVKIQQEIKSWVTHCDCHQSNFLRKKSKPF